MTGRIRCVVYIESTVIASSASIWNNIIFFLPCVRGRGKDKGSFVCGGGGEGQGSLVCGGGG